MSGSLSKEGTLDLAVSQFICYLVLYHLVSTLNMLLTNSYSLERLMLVPRSALEKINIKCSKMD